MSVDSFQDAPPSADAQVRRGRPRWALFCAPTSITQRIHWPERASRSPPRGEPAVQAGREPYSGKVRATVRAICGAIHGVIGVAVHRRRTRPAVVHDRCDDPGAVHRAPRAGAKSRAAPGADACRAPPRPSAAPQRVSAAPQRG